MAAIGAAGLALIAVLAGAGPALAGTVRVAVAANFTAPAEDIAEDFTAETGHEVLLSFGATGGLYAQISQGAPFDVFLAADMARPERAVEEGLAVADTLFTYAVGRLVLYSAVTDVTDGAAVLKAGVFDKIAVADPETAPYGAAAMETLAALGLTEAAEGKIVTGENVSQTLQFIETGNAALGFVALSQVRDKPDSQVWQVPQGNYLPIRQGGVLLAGARDTEAARAFVDFLKGAAARSVIEKAGYAVP